MYNTDYPGWQKLWFGKAKLNEWHHIAVSYSLSSNTIIGFIDANSSYSTQTIAQIKPEIANILPLNFARSAIGAFDKSYPYEAWFEGDIADPVFIDYAFTNINDSNLLYYYNRCTLF